MRNGRLIPHRRSPLVWMGPGGASLCVMLMMSGCRAVAPAVTDTRAPAAPEIPTIMQPTTVKPPPPLENPAASVGNLPEKATPPSSSAPMPSLPPKRSPSPEKPPRTTQPPTLAGSDATAARSAVPDLAVLEQRLRDTRAIGVFTKLSLKNEVDDLLGRFRAAYRAHSPIPTSDLRQRYDLLILKVVTLLQDNDPELARSISFSREALWGILSDPEKFAKIQP